MVRRSKGNRGAVASPACGPEPVTMVPKKITKNEVAIWAVAIFLTKGVGSCFSKLANLWARSDAAPAIRTIDNKK